jgi:tetratricopeptide (TPR) repeat protein
MKRGRELLLSLCLLLAAAAAGAQNLSVVFLEGKADAGRNSKWADLALGSSVHPGATVRLPAGALLRLQGMGVDITLTRPGAYPLRDVAAAQRSAFVGGAGKIASDACRLVAFGAGPQGQVLGATSEETAKPKGEKPQGAVALIAAGKEDISSNHYGAAVEKLGLALGSATANQARELHYCLAYAYSLDGKTLEAWKHADGLTPGGADQWAADCTLLKARLLLDTNAYAEAVSWLSAASKVLSEDAQRAPLYFYLSAMAYRGAGQADNAVKAFTAAAKAAPTTDLGRSAAFLMKIP